MRIAVNTSPLGEELWAGLATYTSNLLRALAKLDDKNSYVVYGMRLNRKELGKNCANFEFKTMPDILKVQSPWYSWVFWHYTGFPVQLLADRPDVFISMYPALPLVRPCPRIVLVYDLTPLILHGAYSMRFRVLFRNQLSYAAKYADRIIAISQSTRKDLMAHFGTDSEKIAVVYPGYDSATFKPEDNLNRIKGVMQKYSIDGNYILYVGTFDPKKNIPRLIEAFARLKKEKGIPHQLVIGGKRTWGDDKVFQAVNELGLEDEIVSTSYVPQEDLPLLMNGADVFVFPSLHEGFGIPPLEAMACGTPVITSNVTSLPEVVGDAGMLVNPYSVDEIAEAIYKVVSDRELREGMRRKGLERAKLFSWERAARETLQILEEAYRLEHTHR